MKPANNFSFISRHSGSVTTGLCNGSVKVMKNSIDKHVWRSLNTKRGGEVISGDIY
jgi:hypothetical protein